MKTLPKLRIPWVTRRWHEREAGVLKRQLDGCMEARRQDAERHSRTLKARDAEIAALTEHLKISERRASELQSESTERAKILSRTLAKLREVERDRDLARGTEQTLRGSIKGQKGQIERLTAERDAALERAARAERQRGDELDQILGLIEAARGRVLECRRADVREGAAVRECAA